MQAMIAVPDSQLLGLGLDAIGTAVALADAESWAVLYENARFTEWFAPGADGLAARLPGLEVERARERLQKGRPFAFETEVRAGPRSLTVAVQLRHADDGRLLLVEGQNISKQKEIEYMLDSYSRMAEKNARALRKEKERAEKLLLNVMPRAIYEEMREYGTTTPQRFEQASVLMLDFAGFTSMAVSRDPSALVAELNDIFSAFDRIVELFGCERIKTIGDGYVVLAGLPEPSADDAANLARIALRMRRYLERRNDGHAHSWRCRIGIATGPLIGSLVGVQKYVYDIFGPAANLAARLEALCEPMQILLCATTCGLIHDEFVVRERPAAEVRGFGSQRLYSLEGEARNGEAWS